MDGQERDRYAHVRDEDFRHHVQEAIRQLGSALSPTAIDSYAEEKLHNAHRSVGYALDQLKRLPPAASTPQSPSDEITIVVSDE
jgi:hypothetical protein